MRKSLLLKGMLCYRTLFRSVIIIEKQIIFTGIVTRIENKDHEKEFITKRQFRRGIGEYWLSWSYSSKMHLNYAA